MTEVDRSYVEGDRPIEDADREIHARAESPTINSHNCQPNSLKSRKSITLPIFFFKQKTAYELETCLEFRRVLFRSIVELEASVGSRFVRHRGVVRGEEVDDRSEECRVGKECRSRWSWYD